MEKRKFLLAILAVTLIFAITAVGCDYPLQEPNDDPESYYNQFVGSWRASDDNSKVITFKADLTCTVDGAAYTYTYIQNTATIMMPYVSELAIKDRDYLDFQGLTYNKVTNRRRITVNSERSFT